MGAIVCHVKSMVSFPPYVLCLKDVLVYRNPDGNEEQPKDHYSKVR